MGRLFNDATMWGGVGFLGWRLALFCGVVAAACSSRAEPAADAGLGADGGGGGCGGDASGPDCLFDTAAIGDRATLALALDGPITESVMAGRTVAEIPFRFTGAAWHGQIWTHRAFLYLPDPYADAGFDRAALYAEVDDLGSDVPNNIVRDAFGREAASRTGIPVAIVASLPPRPTTISTDAGAALRAIKAGYPSVARCFDAPLDENPWKDCVFEIAGATLDWSWNAWAAIAASYLRALVALRGLDAVWRAADAGLGFAAFNPRRFATGGYSKRGIAQWYVAAMDAGVDAIWVGSGEWVNISAMFQRMIDDFGDDGGVFASYVAFYATALGDQYRGVVDPIRWASRLAGVSVTPLRGTDDEIWPFDHLSTYGASFPGLVAAGFIGDAMHVQRESGEYVLTSAESLASWRGVVARLGGAPTPNVVATIDEVASPIRVTATASGVDAGALVRVWWGSALDCTPPDGGAYATFSAWGKDDRDMRDLAWSVQTMARAGGMFEATLPVGRNALPRATQVFVDVRDTDRFLSTTPVKLGDGGTDLSCP